MWRVGRKLFESHRASTEAETTALPEGYCRSRKCLRYLEVEKTLKAPEPVAVEKWFKMTVEQTGSLTGEEIPKPRERFMYSKYRASHWGLWNACLLGKEKRDTSGEAVEAAVMPWEREKRGWFEADFGSGPVDGLGSGGIKGKGICPGSLAKQQSGGGSVGFI